MSASAPRVLAVLFFATAVSQAFGRFTYSLLFTDIRDDFGVSNTAAGAMGSLNLAAYLVGSLVVSLVVGRRGSSLVSRVGLLGVTAGVGLLAWGPNVAGVTVALFMTGFLAAGVWVTAPGLATLAAPADRRGMAIGIVTGGVGAGIVIAGVLDSVLDDGAWRTVYLVELGIALIASVCALIWIRGAPPTRRTQSGRDAIGSIPGWKPLMWSYGMFSFAMALTVTFMVGLLEEDHGYSAGAAALAFSVFGVGTVAGGPLFGPLSDRIGRVHAQVVALALMASSVLVMTTGHRPGATIAAFAFGLSFTGVPVTVGARVADHLDGEAFSAAYGLVTLAFGAGLALGPQVGGVLADATDAFRPAYLLAAVSAAGSALLTVRSGAKPQIVPAPFR